jgi:hypothetical protein
MNCARLTALLLMHATKGIQAHPAKQKWKQLGDKYRAKTPAMWDQRQYNLREELPTDAAQLTQWRTRLAPLQDSACLAHGAKAYMLKQTLPVKTRLQRKKCFRMSRRWNSSRKFAYKRQNRLRWLPNTGSMNIPAKEGTPMQQPRAGYHGIIPGSLVQDSRLEAPGCHGVIGLFVKKVTALHEPLLKLFTKILNVARTHPFPTWFTIRESCRESRQDPRILTERDQETTKDLAQVWLDMRKAFDSLSHHWILRVLSDNGIHQRLVHTIKRLSERQDS